MRMIRNILCACIFIIVTSVPVMSFSLDFDLEIETFKLIKEYWELKDSYYELYEVEDDVKANKYMDKMDRFREKSVSLAEKIVDHKLQEPFLTLYSQLDNYNQEALNETVSVLRTQDPSLNFPGYGYAEPGYQYRKGLELSREKLSTFWREEERFLETNQENELVIELRFLADFTSSLQAGESASVLESFQINVNGEMKNVVKVKYTIHQTLKITCTVKYQKTKVWYELHRRKINWFSYGDWESCGQTYVIDEEPTEDVVAIRM